MLSDYIKRLILDGLQFTPTQDQMCVVESLSKFTMAEVNNKTLVIKGYAGTGKTYLISSYVKALQSLENKFVLLAPTGRAAKVLSRYCKHPAYTIHRHIYRQEGNNDFDAFRLAYNKQKDTVFVVDEASMISNSYQESDFGSGYLMTDLVEYVFSGENCGLILLGDTAQLPPVGTLLSPALSISELKAMGLYVRSYEMTEVVRQSNESGILLNATKLREHIAGENLASTFPRLASHYPDLIPLTGSDLLETINEAYDDVGEEGTIIVTRSNKRAVEFNLGIRNAVLYREERIGVGDLLMVVKNNYLWAKGEKEVEFIANGDVAEVMRIHAYQSRYGYDFADVTLRFPDNDGVELEVKIMLDVLTKETPSLSYNEYQKLYQLIIIDHPEWETKARQRRMMRENPFFNALQVKFAYAVTCHKAQGGQWHTVIVDQGYITQEHLNVELWRWMYTAFTRATDKLYLLNFVSDFYETKSE